MDDGIREHSESECANSRAVSLGDEVVHPHPSGWLLRDIGGLFLRPSAAFAVEITQINYGCHPALVFRR